MSVFLHNGRTGSRPHRLMWFVVATVALFVVSVTAQESSVVAVAVAAAEESSSTEAVVGAGDDYSIAEGNRSLMVALGCFWCAEQAFEQYAPGVVEAVSGYAGGTNDNPTYRNHPGHYEVILIEYDPSKTSYEVLVNYAYRNMDPFDGTGQFCDKGSSYYPAIFYASEEERVVAEDVLETILEQKKWDEADIEAPILPRPVFWTAEDYHQDYYIKNPAQYGYYKNACRRPQRLEEVWGNDEYKCYHEEAHTCFVTADTVSSESNSDAISTSTGTTATSTTENTPGDDGSSSEPEQQLQITNADGELVAAESNIKMVEPEKAALLPTWATALISVTVVGLVLMLAAHLALNKKRHNSLFKTDSHGNEAVDGENDDANRAKPAPTAAAEAAPPSEAPKQEPEEAV